MAIDGHSITLVTLIGQVRAVNPQATNITYKIDDGTSEIDVKKWIDSEKPGDADPKFALDSYVRVWGRLKTFSGRKHLVADLIRAVEDINEVNYHLMEATYVHLYYTKGPIPANGANGAGGDAGGDSMFVDSYGGSGGGGGGGGNPKLNGCSRNAQAMFNFLANSPGGNEGVHLNAVASGAKMQVRDVAAAADELLSSGLIYTTIDDETWAILDY